MEEAQHTVGGVAEAATGEADGRRRIGEIFVELGFISSEQLEDALTVQRRTGGRIGEILVEQGSLTRLDLASALAEHWEPHRVAAAPRALSLAGARPPEHVEALPAQADHELLAALEQRLRAAEQRLDAEHSTPRDARRGWGLRRRGETDALETRIAGAEERLAALATVDRRIADLRRGLEDLTSSRQADAVALGARLSGAEAATVELRSGLDTTAAGLRGGIEAVETRVLALERALDAALATRQADALAVGARLAGTDAAVTELRAGVAALSERPAVEDPSERLLELSVRLDRAARDAHDRLVATAHELHAEVAAIRDTVGSRIDEARAEARSLSARIDELQALRASDAAAARAARAEADALAARVEALERAAAEPAKRKKRKKRKREDA